jgi:ubiquinone/menaquinone biosynthesis C-methylase UbiE
MSEQAEAEYALGYSDGELQRLIRQSEFYADFTEDVLRRAGLRCGMRVLDAGCGAGDVSLLAARLVGPTGCVTGVDRSPKSVALAQRRAEAQGLSNVCFMVGDLANLILSDSFDALIGRFVLTFLTDPTAVLNKLVRHVRAGGIIAFQEMDIGAAARSTPSDLPLWQQCGQWISMAFRQAGVDVQMGPKLFAMFRRAGLPSPQMNLHARIGGGNSAHPEYITSIVSSLLPMIERHGVAVAADIGIDTLTARLREELICCNGVSILPSIIGAWTQAPIQVPQGAPDRASGDASHYPAR